MNRFFKVFMAADDGGGDGGAPPSNSLLDATPPTPALDANPQGDPPANSGIPEDLSTVILGDTRPDWVPEKYWDAESKGLRGLQAVKSALVTESKLAKMQNGNPNPDVPTEAARYLEADGLFGADGNLTLEGLPEGMAINRDDAMLNSFAESAMANGLSTDQYKAVVKDVLTASFQAQTAQGAEYQAQQIELLGADMATIQIETQTYIDKLLVTKAIDQEAYDFAKDDLLSSAAGMKLMQAIARSSVPQNQIPTDQALIPSSQPKFTAGELAVRQNDPRMGTDPDFRAATEAGYKEVYGTENSAGAIPKPLR